jgi:AraC-like DNA-binding protein
MGKEERKLPHSHGEKDELLAVSGSASDPEGFSKAADLMRLLGDPARLRIFWLLCHCEECVVNISSLVDMTSPAVSHHLRALRESGLVTSRRDGREVFYRAAETETSRLLHGMIEQVMEISCPDPPGIDAQRARELTEYQASQAALIREIHDYLLVNLDRQVTIEHLSEKFHINPTTLKKTFREVYGNSLAAHMKEHRMEHAARLLLETSSSISGIAAQVGYRNQSKFTAGFRRQFGMLPHEYRRNALPDVTLSLTAPDSEDAEQDSGDAE